MPNLFDQFDKVNYDECVRCGEQKKLVESSVSPYRQKVICKDCIKELKEIGWSVSLN